MTRKYEKVQELYPEIKKMLEAGYTQQEVAEHYRLGSKNVVKQLLNRERRREEKRAAGIELAAKGRSRKDSKPRDIVAEQAYEIHRLKMQNVLLRNFLSLAGRK